MFRTVLLLLVGLVSFSAAATEYLVVTADSVRVREQPGLSGRSMLMLNRGHLVIKMAEQGNWTKIYFKGRENTTGKNEGWMHSSFLKAEDKVAQAEMPVSLQLVDKGAELVCEKVSGSDFVQGCDLHLKYALKEPVGLAQLSVKCGAELVAVSRKGQSIPVPVNQTLVHAVTGSDAVYSMHILMKADASYQLDAVNLDAHRCQVVGYTK